MKLPRRSGIRVLSRTVARAGATAVLLCTCAAAAAAQSPQEWVARGHRAAADDRHGEAIAAYERAIELDSSLRADLLASLGRQYLWADQPVRAAALLAEYLERGNECDVRSDYGLALSWSDRLKEAERVLSEVVAECPAVATDARLRLATVLRWRGRPSRARQQYEAVLESGDAGQVRAARVGLAHADLLQDYNRTALRRFESLTGTDAEEGRIIALYRLGEHGAVRDYLAGHGSMSPDMRAVAELMSLNRRIEIAPETRLFRDADGTSRSAADVNVTAPLGLRGRVGAGAGMWRLSGAGIRLNAGRAGASVEYRWSPAFAALANVFVTRVSEQDWTPVTGEANAVFTPSDVLRVDVGLARLTVTDNIASVQGRLTGSFGSVGADVRVSPSVTLASAVDRTHWSTGNARTRVRGELRWRLEGTPRLTLRLPALVQLYDEPMPFPFFSPEQYIDVGPGANLFQRLGEHWNVQLDARAGGQRESGRSWNPFFTGHGAVWRNVSDWELRAEAGWSNSNLASSGSFERTSFMLRVTRRF